MATPDNSHTSETAYFNDPESTAEMARLLEQDRLITTGMGGLLSERSNDFSGLHRVLDAACGPGGWALGVARAHPEIEVVGFDISRVMIDYATAQARDQGVDNAQFQVMDLLHPLQFADRSFDLVNARFINFLPAAAWPPLMQEFGRISRPGGFIRLTESEWWYFTSSPALENLNALLIRALKIRGSYSPTGRFTGVLPLLGRFLQEAGCKNIHYIPHAIDFSAGTEAHAGFRRDASIVFKSFQPFLLATGVASQEEVEHLYQQMLLEMGQEDFRGLMLPLTAWGEKM